MGGDASREAAVGGALIVEVGAHRQDYYASPVESGGSVEQIVQKSYTLRIVLAQRKDTSSNWSTMSSTRRRASSSGFNCNEASFNRTALCIARSSRRSSCSISVNAPGR